jgi:hypothetical protein
MENQHKCTYKNIFCVTILTKISRIFLNVLSGVVRRELAAALRAGGDRGREAAAALNRERLHRHGRVPPDRDELGHQQPHCLRLAQQQHPPRADGRAAALSAQVLPQEPVRPVSIQIPNTLNCVLQKHGMKKEKRQSFKTFDHINCNFRL